ncbi:MAG TPA: biotin transporter BioY [Candidatus Eisenbacteria bacterium]|jgi:biotin transport system substrate-specific component|nr:biotin transporter BioY [Candidatus Eisenbacteria bacterium]
MTTLVDRLRHPASSRALTFDLPLVLASSGLLALSAQIAVPLPFSPVPVTAQTLALTLLAAALGRARASAMAFAYLVEGAAGLPVFAGGSAGAHILVGPTGGYLAGFVPAAWLVGALAERGFDRRFWTTALAMFAGNGVVLLFGAAWLARFVGAERALTLGVAPFLVGDVVKTVIAAVLLPLSWRALGRSPGRTDVRP